MPLFFSLFPCNVDMHNKRTLVSLLPSCVASLYWPPVPFSHSHHPPPTATDLPTLPQATNQKASAPMAKTGNKATRKLAKKGLLDFTSRGMCGWG